jgi:hypothetical protein
MGNTLNFQQWRDSKQVLISAGQGDLDWLAAFDKTADEQIAATLTQTKSQIVGYPFNPFLVEMLLGDISALLDRAAAYKKEAAELEINAVTAAVEHYYSGLSLDEEEALAILVASNEPDALEKKGADDAYGSFSKGTTPLESGLSAFAQQKALALATQSNNALKRQEHIKQRFEAARTRRAKLLERLLAPGSAMNYRERYQRALSLLEEDVADAYTRIICAQAGLAQRLRIQQPVPSPSSPKPLESLISWARQAMRDVEHLAERQSEINIVVPLRQPRLTDTSLVTESDWQARMADNGTGAFDMTLSANDYLKGLDNPRITQVGVTYVPLGSPDPVAQRSRRIAVKLFLPNQDLPQAVSVGGMTPSYRLPPIIFADVPCFGQGEPQWAVGINVRNASPAGQWKLMIAPRVLGLNNTKEMRKDVISDLRLHLKLLAIAEPDPSKWSASD